MSEYIVDFGSVAMLSRIYESEDNKLKERIVRCRDCEYKDEPWNCAAPYYVEPDGFCKWGERK